jgi:hypothetical protein
MNTKCFNGPLSELHAKYEISMSSPMNEVRIPENAFVSSVLLYVSPGRFRVRCALTLSHLENHPTFLRLEKEVGDMDDEM